MILMSVGGVAESCVSSAAAPIERSALFTVETPFGVGTAFATDVGVVTAAHVVEGLPRVALNEAGSSEGPLAVAEVSFLNRSDDIAVLTPVEPLPTSLPWSSTPVRVGDCLVAWGGPPDAFDRHRGTVLEANSSYVDTSSLVLPGTSGGPVVDADGAVVAMVVSRSEAPGAPLTRAVTADAIMKTSSPLYAVAAPSSRSAMTWFAVAVAGSLALGASVLGLTRRRPRREVLKITFDEERA